MIKPFYHVDGSLIDLNKGVLRVQEIHVCDLWMDL